MVQVRVSEEQVAGDTTADAWNAVTDWPLASVLPHGRVQEAGAGNASQVGGFVAPFGQAGNASQVGGFVAPFGHALAAQLLPFHELPEAQEAVKSALPNCVVPSKRLRA